MIKDRADCQKLLIGFISVLHGAGNNGAMILSGMLTEEAGRCPAIEC